MKGVSRTYTHREKSLFLRLVQMLLYFFNFETETLENTLDLIKDKYSINFQQVLKKKYKIFTYICLTGYG